MVSKSRDQVRLLTGHSPISEKHSDTHDSKPIPTRPHLSIHGMLVRELDGTYRFKPFDKASEELLQGIQLNSISFILKTHGGPNGPTATRILRLLEEESPLTSRQIVSRLGATSSNYVHRLLRKMERSCLVSRPRRGLYCLQDGVTMPHSPSIEPVTEGTEFNVEYQEDCAFLTDADTLRNRILRVLWEEGPLTVTELTSRLRGARPDTVHRCLYSLRADDVISQPKRRVDVYCLHHHTELALKKVNEECSKTKRSSRRKRGSKRIEPTPQVRIEIDRVLEEHLQRNGGACLIQVRTISRRIQMRFPEIGVTRLNEMIDSHLASIKNAEFWDNGWSPLVSRPHTKAKYARRLYSIRWSGAKATESEVQFQKTTIADAIESVIRCVLAASRVALSELSQLTKIRGKTLTKAVDRLVESQVLRDEAGVFSIAPQEDPVRVRIIKSVADSGRSETIRSLLLDYARHRQIAIGKPFFDLRRLKKHIREQLIFFKAFERRPVVNTVLDSLVGERVLTQLDGSIYRLGTL